MIAGYFTGYFFGVDAKKSTEWNPAEFSYWFRTAAFETRVRAWSDLTSRQKLYTEFDLFRRFT
jgi:hypothetical protein